MKNFSIIFLVVLVTLLAGCGGGFDSGPLWPELPVGVYVQDAELVEDVGQVIEFYGQQFDAFYLGDDSSPIVVKCMTPEEDDSGVVTILLANGTCTVNERDGIIESAIVEIQCGNVIGSVASVIAHELWHALGFGEHSENDDCVSSDSSNRAINICDEMVEQFDEMYGIGG